MESKYSDACCTIPPVTVKDYQTKGSYTAINGMNTCRSYEPEH